MRKLKNKLVKFTLLYVSFILYCLDIKRTKRNGGKTIILVFHHLDEPKKLESLLDLAGRNFNLISFGDWLNKKISKDQVNVILSFDDGYESWSNALRILKNYRVKGCLFFICSEFIDNKYPEFCQKIGTWAEPSISTSHIYSIVNDHYIGSHTDNHTSADQFDFAELDQLCYEDIKLINEYDAGSPLMMALVKGIFPKSGRPNESRFDYIFSCESGYLEDNPNYPQILPRTNVGLRSTFLMMPVIAGHFNTVLTAYLKISTMIKSISE